MERMQITNEALEKLMKYHVPIDRIIHPGIVCYAPGEMLCRDGESSNVLLFLLSGRAKAFYCADNGMQLILCLYQDFGVVDDMELFLCDGVHHICCQAISEVTAVTMPIRENRKILLESTPFLKTTCVSFANSLLRNRNHFQNILYTTEERLCSYIALTQIDKVWSDNLTQVADMLGVSYRHLLRTLRRLCDRKILAKSGNGYCIVDHIAFSTLDKGFFAPTE